MVVRSKESVVRCVGVLLTSAEQGDQLFSWLRRTGQFTAECTMTGSVVESRVSNSKSVVECE